MSRLRALESEGDILVAGTENVEQAMEFLKTWHNPNAEWTGWMCEEHQTWTCACPTDADMKPERARVGWFRIVPGCPAWCGEGHQHHWHDAKPHARGAFPVVAWWCP